MTGKRYLESKLGAKIKVDLIRNSTKISFERCAHFNFSTSENNKISFKAHLVIY